LAKLLDRLAGNPGFPRLIVLHSHFIDQPEGTQVFRGYALHPDRIGDFVAKPMAECTGAEILQELCGHLNFDQSVMASATCIPCRMPYITSMFMPRALAADGGLRAAVG
jgi:oleate hydratase